MYKIVCYVSLCLLFFSEKVVKELEAKTIKILSFLTLFSLVSHLHFRVVFNKTQLMANGM